jgi:hypothetical protein
VTGSETPAPALDEAEIERRWLEACANADVEAGVEAHLEVIPGSPANSANFAVHYHPGHVINTTGFPDKLFPLTEEQRATFNSAGVRDTHRIAVFTHVDPRVLSALLRHELQHVRQFRSHRQAYCHTDLANGVLGNVYGSRNGSGALLNAAPLEQEANLAASRYLRSLDGEPTADELAGLHATVLGQVDLPWGEDDLPAETLAFLALHPDELETVLPPGQDAATFIARLHPDTARLWQRLRDDPELQERRASFHDLVPSDEAIAAAGDRPGDAWLPLLQALIAARDRARTVIRDATAAERSDP